MKLLKTQHFARLASAPETEGDSFSLRITTNLKSLLTEWGPTTRISPVWRLKPVVENAKPTDAVTADIEVFFLSGTTPAWFSTHLSDRSLALLGDDSMYLTLGAFSLLIISYFDEVSEEIRDLCSRHTIPYEFWNAREEPVQGSDFEEINGDQIRIIDPGEFTVMSLRRGKSYASTLLDNASIQADDPLGIMTLELYTLLAVVETRSIGPLKVLSDDAARIEGVVTSIIAEEEDHAGEEPSTARLRLPEREPQDLLLTLNAALSRLCSQALAGTSPIMQTECHFWPHSFLGIGTASLALRNLADFISNLVVRSDYHERYETLLKDKAEIPQDSALSLDQDLPPYLNLKPDAIARLDSHSALLAENLSTGSVTDYDVATPITYFSGRDGFTNNALTVSAPLPSVSGCNSFKWNLGTITHELSHRIVADKLVDLFHNLLSAFSENDIGSTDLLFDWFEAQPETVGEYAEKLLGFTLLCLHAEDFGDGELKQDQEFSAFRFFRDAKELYSVQIEETLVHIFDFFHFYGSDSRLYMDFVWLSWAVQPSIIQKTDEYIKRTVMALSVSHLLSENWRERAMADFIAGLESKPLASGLPFQREILDALAEDQCRQGYEDYLEKMQHLLTLFHLVFKSETLRELAGDEAYRSPRSIRVKGGEGKSITKRFNYAVKPNVFSTGDPASPAISFSNPLLFSRDFSRQTRPNAAGAAWLLHMLAYNYLPPVIESDR